VIGRMHHVVIDCPDPAALAAFYSELLGLPITYGSDDWVVIAKNETTSGVAFQRAPDYKPPEWRTPTGRNSSTWTSWWTTSLWPKLGSSRWVPCHCAAVTTSTPTLPDTRSASSPARPGHHRLLQSPDLAVPELRLPGEHEVAVVLRLHQDS
jgi:hypothetical protein